MADSLKTPAHIVPEWYYLPFYRDRWVAITFRTSEQYRSTLQAFGGRPWVMFGSIIVLFFLP